MHEKEHVIKILERTKQAIKEEDVLLLKELSNQTIHTSSMEQDTDSIMIAIIVYSCFLENILNICFKIR